MSEAALSAAILGLALVLFVSNRVRHDLVAVIALGLTVAAGLATPGDALLGFGNPAVVAVAAVLMVGRAVELSGVASAAAIAIVPRRAPFVARLGGVLVMGALLSAFMNNIAALVITMPIATAIARDARRPPSAVLMPLAYATILGGMTTLIGTPANLILSSVREDALGEGLGFFSMTPVGVAVASMGLLYLATIGRRLIPARAGPDSMARRPWRVFELLADAPLPVAQVTGRLRAERARVLAHFRSSRRLCGEDALARGDRLLVLTRTPAADVAAAAGLRVPEGGETLPDEVTARVSVAHGSLLIGLPHGSVRDRSGGQVRVVAAGPRAALLRQPLAHLRIAAGDQLFIRGTPPALAALVARARLLEIDRLDSIPLSPQRAIPTLVIFFAAIAAAVLGGINPAFAFLAAAAAMAALRLVPTREVYTAVDWPVVVLLAAMIPVGASFEASGAAGEAAAMLAVLLEGASAFWALAAICAATVALSVALNNVATAVIMGPLALDLAPLLGLTPDAALLAVLVGTSADFLTPIGHQNNLLVMGPGGYRFTDYARVGAPLCIAVVLTAAFVLSW